MNQPRIAVLWDRPSVSVVCQLLLLCCVSLAAVSPAAGQAGKQTSLTIWFQNSPPRAPCVQRDLRVQPLHGDSYWFGIGARKDSREARSAAERMRDAIGHMAEEGALVDIDLRWNSQFTSEALAVFAFQRAVIYQMVLIGALGALTGAFAAMLWLVRRLRVARRQAEAGNRAKSEFLANACLLKPVRKSQLLEALSSTWSRRSLAALAAHVEQRAGSQPDHSPARVLVADDNAANRRAAVRMLESLGLRADVSANGREAVDMLRLLPYDLVLMDCHMPFMNGQEAAMEIRKREPPDRRTPIVAMTAETGADCLDDCLASGMDDILLKPVRREKLMATLHRWLPAGQQKHLPVGGAAG